MKTLKLVKKPVHLSHRNECTPVAWVDAGEDGRFDLTSVDAQAGVLAFRFRDSDHWEVDRTPAFYLAAAQNHLALFKQLTRVNVPRKIILIGPEKSLLLALCEGALWSLHQETANIKGVSVRCTSVDDPEVARVISSTELFTNGPKLFFIGHQWFVEDYAPIVLGPASDVGKRFVIVGGAGGLGTILCRHIVKDLLGEAVVIGRRRIDEALRIRLRASGAKAYLQADVEEGESLGEALAHVHERYGAIDGVFHLAGQLRDKRLSDLDPEDIRIVLGPKISGALHLSRIADTLNIPFVCYFSSLTSMTGQMGQTAYGAANAFLDQHAICKSSERSRILSVNWGLWQSDGMKITPGISELSAMDGDLCCKILFSLIAGGENRALVWESETASVAPLSPRQDQERAPFNASSLGITGWLRAIVKRYTGFDNIEDTANFLESGIDSVAIISIASAIERAIRQEDTAFRLHKATLFDYPSIASLEAHLLTLVTPDIWGWLFKVALPTSDPGLAGATHLTSNDKFQDQGLLSPKPELLRHKDESVCTERSGPKVPEGEVAIIGISGEFPGADSVEELWELLAEERCSVEVIPKERWDWRSMRQQGIKGRHGGFIRKAKIFDPEFFNIAPKDAEAIDPAERRMLIKTYHALENAGRIGIRGEKVGVFVASMYGHYQDLDHPTRVVSSSLASIANRVSYYFDFKGPSVGVDSMCSGSMTALHLAIQAIKNGDCSIAIVGGVNIMAHFGKYRMLTDGKFIGESGRCQSFGSAADGYVPGEGVCVLVIQALSEAQLDGSPILATIKGSALNSGGRTSGYHVPSARAQAQVVREALARARVPPEEVRYVEAHGTGTKLGDPIEVLGLHQAYGAGSVCYLGSVKSNIGHLESAAGMAAIAKVLGQFQKNQIFASLFASIENPHLALLKTRFQIAKRTRDFDFNRHPIVGISSFGAGGSNSHFLLKKYLPRPSKAKVRLKSYLIPLSAKSDAALRRRVADLRAFVTLDIDLYGLSYTLCLGREHHKVRQCFVVCTASELLEVLGGGVRATDAVSESYLRGEMPAFQDLFPEKSLIKIPNYPFEEEEYWLASLEATKTSDMIRTADRPFEGDFLRAESADVIYSAYQDLDMPQPNPRRNVRRLVVCGPQEMHLFPPSSFATMLIPGELREYLQRQGSASHDEIYISLNHLALADAFELGKALYELKESFRLITLAQTSAFPDEKEPLQKALYGLFQTLGLERANLKAIAVENCGYESLSEDEYDMISGLLFEGFELYRMREGRLWKRGLTTLEMGQSQERFKAGGTYLVMGGLGAVGAEIVRHLTRHYDGRVVIVGRSTLHGAKESLFSELATEGGQVVYKACDISCSAGTNRMVEEIEREFGNIDGIFQSTAVIRDTLFGQKTLDDFQSVLSSKVNGSVNIDLATKHHKLSFFTLFSSQAAVFANVGQADYVVANIFLQNFSTYRNTLVAKGERSGHTLAIDWPLWLEKHKETSGNGNRYKDLGAYLNDSYGLAPLSNLQGMAILTHLVNGCAKETSQVMPMLGNGQKIRTKLLRIDSEFPKDKLEGISEEYMDEAIRTAVCQLTGLAEAAVTADMGFGDMGFDSVKLQVLAQRLSAAFGVVVAPVAFFRHNTLSTLAAHLKTLQKRNIPVAVLPEPKAVDATSPSYDNRYAIVGIDGRMPGGKSLEDFWQLLFRKESAIRNVARWQRNDYQAGLIEEMEYFDPKFFGMSPKEAKLLDPQHRLFLQASYNAFWDAGYNPRTLRRVGVFAGVQFTDYQTLLQRNDGQRHPFAATGNAHAMLANRVSYQWDFHGPSQTVDTACSSAFVALKQGISSLKAQECDYALVGAVSLLLDPDVTDAAISMGVQSPNFRCATFDAAADGYVRGEGVGVILVKRLADAVRDGDAIHGVIESCVENHGGRAHSLTAPNPEAQIDLLQRAYTSELATEVAYIEAHGTGTHLGDPIEVESLKAAFANMGITQREKRIRLGSVKSNVGHLEPAAGMASLFKVLLAMRYEVIPATIHFKNLNPNIELSGSPFEIATVNTPWPNSQRQVAGISSFGFGGSNTHVVLGNYLPKPRQEDKPTLQPLMLSAKSQESLFAMAQRLADAVEQDDSMAFSDIVYTCNTGRESLPWRIALLVTSKGDIISELRKLQIHELRETSPAGIIEVSVKHTPAALVEAFLDGVTIDFAQLSKSKDFRRVHLPGYVFDTKPYWFEDRLHDA